MQTDLELVILLGTVVGTALVARLTQLPITALEIVAGIALVGLVGLRFPAEGQTLIIFGSLLIVFLAGLETNLAFLRTHLRKAFTLGLGGFLVPFAGLFALFYLGLHAPLLLSIIGATAVADTSISIVYTTLNQFELTDLPFGRLILASTLMVNLFEDFTVTTTTFLTAPGLLFTLGVLGALLAASLLLPRLSRAVGGSGPPLFSNISTRALLFSLAVLAALSALVGVPGILFVFLMGLMFSKFADDRFLADVRKFGFALFVPLYFVAVGLRVDVGFVIANLPVLGLIVGAASGLKLAVNYPILQRWAGSRRALPVSVLMNTRLTSASVILLLTVTLGLITVAWYSLMISAVAVLALASSAALRTFPSFSSPRAARALLGSTPVEASLDPVGRRGFPSPGLLARDGGPPRAEPVGLGRTVGPDPTPGFVPTVPPSATAALFPPGT
ncbi:MAG TPA: cation:proton antiporter [Thermoplasmata archaeon]|nr:cation:proton antiporter [Thermoplasmata archaeon]